MDDDVLRELNVPWMTKDGLFDLAKFPIESILRQAVGNNAEQFRSACTLLSVMYSSGRTEAGVFLLGLLKFCGNDMVKKAQVVDALKHVPSRQAADLLFEELELTESSNSSRGYINAILKTLQAFPRQIVEEGFHRLLSESRWSYKMKRRFQEILENIE